MVKALSDNEYYRIIGFFCRKLNSRRADRYFGMMDIDVDKEKLAEILQNKFFAMSKNAHGTKAVIYDDKSMCDAFCAFSTEYHTVDFGKFKEVTENKWTDINNYHTPSGCGNAIFYADGI